MADKVRRLYDAIVIAAVFAQKLNSGPSWVHADMRKGQMSLGEQHVSKMLQKKADRPNTWGFAGQWGAPAAAPAVYGKGRPGKNSARL